MTTDRVFFEESTYPIRLNYSSNTFKEVISIPDSGYFKQFDIYNDPEFFELLELSDDTINFDIFSSIFYLITRCEEYREFEKDEHGRFSAYQSILYKKTLLNRPIVDEWIKSLKQFLENIFGISIQAMESPTFISTIDIDIMYAFKNKSLWLQLASLMKDCLRLNLSRIRDRLLGSDPYDTYAFLKNVHEEYGHEGIVFIQCSKRSKYDKGLSPDSHSFKNVVDSLKTDFDIGIHPSYDSDSKAEIIENEKKKLESLSGSIIKKSRQHFLRVSFPDTYRALIESGIELDYSMGYHDSAGFRAGTSYLFNWYDLERDQATQLKIVPFQIMDVCYRKYQKREGHEIFQDVKRMIDRTFDIGGNLSIIWHNSSFYEQEGWEGYDKLYRGILEYAKQKLT